MKGTSYERKESIAEPESATTNSVYLGKNQGRISVMSTKKKLVEILDDEQVPLTKSKLQRDKWRKQSK